jgi:hypothetical protein
LADFMKKDRNPVRQSRPYVGHGPG